VLILLPTATYIVLRSPHVQTYIARKAANHFSEMLNTEISIGGVNINLSLDLILEDLQINDQHKNPLLAVEELRVNTKKIRIKDNILKFDKIILHNALINLCKYSEDSVMNYQFIINHLNPPDTTPIPYDTISAPEEKALSISCSYLQIINSSFIFQDQHIPPVTDRIDYDNINISSLNVEIKDFSMLGDSVTAKIEKIALNEHSGFVLDKFSSDFIMSPSGMHAGDLKIITGRSDLSLDLIFKYKDFSYFNDFLQKIRIISSINESVLDLNDLQYFAPELRGMENILSFSGDVKGYISNLRVKEFKLDLGKRSHFYGDVFMNGLPYIKETFINTTIKEFVTNTDDVAAIIIPAENGKITNIEIQESFAKFGDINICGHFTGFYNDFVAYAKLNSSLGMVTTDMIFKHNKEKQIIEYNGKIEAEEFNFGLFSGLQDYFGKLTLNADISGSGLTKESIAVEMNGTIDSLDFNNNNYSSISIKGNYENETFNGSLNVLDELIHLDFLGIIDFSKTKPVFDFTSVIKNADLIGLNMVSSEEKMVLSTKLNINFTGLSIDSIIGKIKIDNTVFTKANQIIKMDQLSLEVLRDTSGDKNITVVSDFVDVKLQGAFQLENIFVSFDKFLDEYLMSVDMLSDSIKNSYSDDQIISFNINLKNTHDLTEVFVPRLSVSPNSVVSGTYNGIKGHFDFNGTADKLIYAGNGFENFFIKGMSENKKILFRCGCERLSLSDSIGLDDFALNARIMNDSIDYNILWESHDTIKNSGDIAGFINFNNHPFIESKLNKFEVIINDSLWLVNKDNYIIFDSTSVEVSDLDFSSINQFVKIKGKISSKPNDKIELEFKDFDISNLDLLLQTDDIDIDGFLNGKATLIDIYNSPNFISDLKVKDLHFNNDKLGDAFIKSSWNDAEQSLYINTEVIYKGNYGENKTLLINGYYFPVDEGKNFDLGIAVNNFKLKTLNSLFSGFRVYDGSLATGSVKLSGTKDNPDLTGKIKFLRTAIKVDYLNTTYSFSDEIQINNNNFTFNNMTIYDSLGNTAIVSGKISHDHFKDFALDVNIKTEKLSCLNTSFYQNDEFYGSVFFTGEVDITGLFNDVNLDISGKTEKSTNFFIPLSSSSEVSDNNYITFINYGDTIIQVEDNDSKISNLNLNINLKATSDAGVEIIMPAQTGNIKANGDGFIKLEVNPDGNFNIYGDYIISKGSYLFTIQNVIHKHFAVRRGGIIKWSGSPYDADINLRGVYSIRAPLSGLMLASDSSGVYNQRIAVDCILDLKGKLFNPEIKFSIELPDSDYETQQLVYSQIDTNNQAQMSEQMIFLLVLNQFKPVSGNEVAMYSGVGATSLDILTSQLSNWLSQISDDFDIGVNYRPGNDITSEEIEVALSTQLFNNRVSIDGNFGVAGTDETEKASNIVGDVNVEVKITEDGRFRVKAFNKTNNVNSIEYNAPYTQGVGVFYRKEFDNFSDLFRRKKQVK